MSGDPHNPCHLEGEFRSFREELRTSQRDQMALLQTIAAQGRDLSYHATALKELSERTRDLEMKPVKSANKAFWVAISSFTSIIGGVTVGLIMSRLA